MTRNRATFGLSEIGQIALTVNNLEAATAFYRDQLGLPFLFEVPGMAFFQCGGVRLLLGTAPEGDADYPAAILYYRVDDIESAFKSLSERGVVFEAEPHVVHKAEDHELWLAFFWDGERRLAALMSEVPRG